MNTKDMEIVENASLNKINTYKIPSEAKYLITIKSVEALIKLIAYLQKNNIKYFILGGGSNVILDDYFDGVIIKLDGLDYINIDDVKVTSGAGVMLGKLARTTINFNLTGLEWSINIPGSLGGSIVGNAGAYNSEMFDNLISIKVLTKDLKVIELKKDDIKYEYRHTNIKEQGLIVLEGTFLLKEGNKEESLELVNDRCKRRALSQPLDKPSAGSVFRNPPGDYAGRLIEAAGLKGKVIGDAMVSDKHANFIVNIGNATGNDIKSLIELVKTEVKKQFGVDLILEQEIVDWK